jgi:hypothetical protein
MNPLEMKFTQQLIKKCEQAQKECNCNSTRFLQTVEKSGGVKAVKMLLSKDQLSDGFETLKMCGRLDLSMEVVVIDNQFADLFTDDEVNTCFMRLCECNFFK